MRILIWTDGFWPDIGGMEFFCMNLAVGMKQRGHECLIIADRQNPADLGQSQYQEMPVFGVTFYTARRKGDLPSIRRQHEACKALIDAFNPDVIHLNTVMRSALGFVLQQRNRRYPAVMTLHDHVLLEDRTGMVPATLQKIDAIAAISQYLRTSILDYDPALEGKLHSVLNALPMPDLPPAPFPAEQRLLVFGRLCIDKGFDLAIQAFAQIAPRFPSLTLTVAGHGLEYPALRELAQKSGLSERIHFPGWVRPEDIPALINQHSLVIMPSRWQEPFGLVALQTAQMGRPIIASRTGAIPEIVEDQITGRLFENENLAALTECLQCFLENPTLGQKMGNQAYFHALKHFNFDGFLSDYENLYQRVRGCPSISPNAPFGK